MKNSGQNNSKELLKKYLAPLNFNEQEIISIQPPVGKDKQKNRGKWSLVSLTFDVSL